MSDQPQNEKPRVRLAPSPTGLLHVGTARTALYNYLFAKKHGGSFVLRIEDTDQERSKEEYEKDVLRHLSWLGLKWEEGPKDADDRRLETRKIAEGKTYKNADDRRKSADEADLRLSASNKKNNSFFNQRKSASNYGPYRQSERRNIYKKYLRKLLDEGKAFYCFHEKRGKSQNKERRGISQNKEERRESQNKDAEERRLAQDKEEINADKKGQESSKDGRYRVHWCEHKNLSESEVKNRLDKEEDHVIRFATPKDQEIKFEDEIRGEISYDSDQLGDFSLAKSLTEPLYNLACVVDDHKMHITHVIRGEDHIPNTPKQVILYNALGLDIPKFAHLPLILGEDGEKLSKRRGATSVREYKKEGYLPSALNNFMALLGWHPTGDKELFLSLEELIEAFSLKRVRPSGAVFNKEKLTWFNKQHLKNMDIKDFAGSSLPYLKEAGFVEEKPDGFFLPKVGKKVEFDYLEDVVSLEQKRAENISQVPELIDFFFQKEIDYEGELLIWKDYSEEEVRDALGDAKEALEGMDSSDFKKEKIEKNLLKRGEDYEDRGLLLWPLRVALTGKEGSPGPFEVAAILGKERAVGRIEEAISLLS